MTTMERSRMKSENVNKFIEVVEQFPAIWDIKCRQYRDKDMRKAAIEDVAAEMNWTELEVQEKFRNLRTYYVKEKRKLNNINIKNTNAGLAEVYKTNWEYFDALDAFLSDSVKQRLDASNFSIQHSNSYCDSDESEDTIVDTSGQCEQIFMPESKRPRFEYDLLKNPVTIVKEEPRPTSAPIPAQTLVPPPAPAPAPAAAPAPAPAPTPAPSLTSATSSDALFGQMIAKDLESITDLRTKQYLKLRIQRLVVEAQFKEDICPHCYPK